MKYKNNIAKLLLFTSAVLITACSQEEKPTGSQLDITKPQQSTLDVWIENNYLKPYNINVQYKWNQNTVDPKTYVFPPTQEKVLPALNIVKKIWINSYSEIGGADFVKKLAPREIVLIGGVNRQDNGTILLGLAEGGQRITFFETDYVNQKDRANVTRFIHTIQHEYIHILNQHVPFDEKAYQKITPSDYTATWYLESTENSRKLGFITPYSRFSYIEDFAEMASTILTSSKVEYETILKNILNVPVKVPTPTGPKTEITVESQKAYNSIKAKEAIVVKYFKDAFKIDFYKLRDAAERNTTAVINE